jgi:hypothetical protein
VLTSLVILASETGLYVTLLWLNNDRNAALAVLCVFCSMGLLGFLVITRQFVVIRAIDLAGRPATVEPEVSHVS